jgi:hypothetical protein
VKALGLRRAISLTNPHRSSAKGIMVPLLADDGQPLTTPT